MQCGVMYVYICMCLCMCTRLYVCVCVHDHLIIKLRLSKCVWSSNWCKTILFTGCLIMQSYWTCLTIIINVCDHLIRCEIIILDMWDHHTGYVMIIMDDYQIGCACVWLSDWMCGDHNGWLIIKSDVCVWLSYWMCDYNGWIIK